MLRFVSDGAGEGVDGGRPARAAVPPASAVGSVFTRPSPTSRGLGRCVSFRMGRGRKQTAAGPRAGACRLRGIGRRCLALWARGAADMRGRRCLPCGQRRCRAARRIMAYHEKEHVPERFPHQKTFPTRRGTGKRASPRKGRSFPARRQLHVLPMSLSPQETDICAISQTKRAPFPCKTFHIYPSAANAAFYKARLPAPAFRGEHPARAQAQLSIPCKIPAFPAFHPSHRRLIPQPSRRENGGLCPRPLKGPDP